ncbi:5'-methylthioadenosine/S-adenosylhomocysteine nucleosidase family protein [Actinoplanes awajinensis]|uniref:Purine phosphorylase n=1 Tax=Actinoplanes awajinensis subsp. mycoplanecinus TaxID=135947 RepID=A0A124G9H9_9ACTN|nr:5'-methylthioadenosine/S-adenosylhomocysteine nucleosidase [Actinoplanes awajinensis]KUL29186.1 purine phosphorylase [Actinoplanes awajinensis subsp. mycoplanecinus]
MSTDVVVILTALNVEYEAVRKKINDPQVHWHPAGTRFETGRLGPRGCRVVLGLVGQGNNSSAVLAERAITEFSPAALLFVGVAGALWPGVELGEVVVASQVYAYHGGTSEDDGLKARPKAWEISHRAGQIVQHLIRTGEWFPEPRARVRFAPIAAGEVVQDSRISEQARWVRQHYNNALAIEMEAAGVAQAAHLNDALPVVVVRGISDRADGTKAQADGANWQPRAAAHAAAFAAALANELVTQGGNGQRQTRGRETPMGTNGPSFTNIAQGNARVGAQYGQVIGNVTSGGNAPDAADLATELATFRDLLNKAHLDGRLDDDTYAAANDELDGASGRVDEQTPASRGKLLVALKKLNGLVGDTADLAAHLAAIISLAKDLS